MSYIGKLIQVYSGVLLFISVLLSIKEHKFRMLKFQFMNTDFTDEMDFYQNC